MLLWAKPSPVWGTALFAMTCLLAVGGCQWNRPAPPSPFDAPSQPPAEATAQPTLSAMASPSVDPPPEILVFRLRLIRIDVPLGTASSSEQLWHYLNEEPTGPAHPVTLGANGLRVGVAPRECWPDLSRTLDRMTGQPAGEEHYWAMPGEPMPLCVRKDCGDQTIFTVARDRTISGCDYEPGDNLMTVVCTMNPTDANQFLLTVVPQIRSARSRQYFERVNGIMTTKVRPTFYSLSSLAFRLRARSGDLVVIGPSAAATRKHTVGHHFLTFQKKGVPFESVLVAIPQIDRATVKPPDLAGGSPVGPERPAAIP